MAAISRFEKKGRWDRCGEQGEYANGNGGLMRIMPVCLYAAFMESEGSFNLFDAVMAVQRGTLLTHGHLRACTASGIYFFLCREILRFRGFTGNSGNGLDAFPVRSTGHSLKDLLQRGMDEAVRFYSEHNLDDEFSHFSRMKDLSSFAAVPAEKIRSSGYVVHTLEAAVWCLITTGSLEQSQEVSPAFSTDMTRYRQNGSRQCRSAPGWRICAVKPRTHFPRERNNPDNFL